MSSTKTKLRVGSADDADIVIKQATVSRYHCELRWKNGTWELHDLNSTNGTFVDGERVTEAILLEPASVVTLGRGIPLKIPAPPTTTGAKAQRRERESAQEPATAPTNSSVLNKWIYVAATAGVMLLLGLLVLTLVNSGGDKQTPQDTSTAQQVAPATASERIPELPRENSGNVARVANADDQKPKLEAAELIQCDPAFWAVLAESSDGKSQKLLGTAIAVGPSRLITLASIIEAVEAVKSSYPRFVLAQPANTSKRLTPVKVDVNPANKAALANYQDFEKRLADRINSQKELKEPSLEESLDWSQQAETIMADIAKSDFACISIQESLEKYLPLAKEVISSQPTNCMLRGFPTFVPSPEIRSNLSLFYLDLPANCRMDTRLKQPTPLVESSDLAGFPMLSMVCVNQKSEIVGLCVREEPVQDVAAPKRGQIVVVEAFW